MRWWLRRRLRRTPWFFWVAYAGCVALLGAVLAGWPLPWWLQLTLPAVLALQFDTIDRLSARPVLQYWTTGYVAALDDMGAPSRPGDHLP